MSQIQFRFRPIGENIVWLVILTLGVSICTQNIVVILFLSKCAAYKQLEKPHVICLDRQALQEQEGILAELLSSD